MARYYSFFFIRWWQTPSTHGSAANLSRPPPLMSTFALLWGVLRTPLRFFQIVAPPFLAHLITHLFRTYCENFRPRSRKVRSPDHVKWPHLTKSLNVRQRYTDWTNALKLSAIAINNSVYKMNISEFRYRWPKVRSILWPLHYKSMGEKWKAPLLNKNHSKHSQTSG